jgi:hypothetical protein
MDTYTKTSGGAPAIPITVRQERFDVHTYMHTYIHAYIHIHTYIHTYIHTTVGGHHSYLRISSQGFFVTISHRGTCRRGSAAVQGVDRGQLYVCMYVSICIFVCMCVCMKEEHIEEVLQLFKDSTNVSSVCMYVYVCMCMCVQMRASTHMQKNAAF